MGDAEPQPAPVVRVSDLAPAERDRVFHFLLEQDIQVRAARGLAHTAAHPAARPQFYRSDEGKYIANVRMVAPDHPDAQAPEEEIAPAVGEASPKVRGAAASAQMARRPGLAQSNAPHDIFRARRRRARPRGPRSGPGSAGRGPLPRWRA